MRCATMLMIFSAGLAMGQAWAQVPEPPRPPALRLNGPPEVAAPEPLSPPTPSAHLGGSLPSTAVPPSCPVVSLAELEEMAQCCNPTLAVAAARVEAARGRYVQAGLYPNPVAGYLGSEIGNERRAGQQGGFVSQEIVTAKKLQFGRNAAAQEVRQAEYAWETQRQRVLTDVRRGFYDVLAAQRTVDLSQQLVQIGDEGVKSTESLMKAKEVARGDLLQARIESDSAKVLLEKSRNRYVAAWRSLIAVVGAANMTPTPLAGNVEDDLPQLTWDETFARLVAQSPQMATAQAGVARAQAALRQEWAGRVPNVDLQAAVQYDNATRDTFASVQVGVPVRLYNRNQGNIRRAQAELLAAQNDVQKVQLALQQRLAAVFEQYTNARYQAEKYKHDILPNAEASLKLTTSGYKQGEYSYLAVLTAQRTFFQTSLTYLDALRELRAAATAIEGHLLSDSLQSGDAADRPQ